MKLLEVEEKHLVEKCFHYSVSCIKSSQQQT